MTEYITIPKRRRNIINYFIFVFFILPVINYSGLSSVVGRFIPNPIGYNLLAFVLSLPLLRSFNKNYGNLRGVVHIIRILILYILVRFISTASKTSFFEALTVFRYSYIQVLNLFILLPFIFSLNQKEINYILKRIFKCLIVFTLLYLSNNLIYDWMGVKGSLIENVGGIEVDRSVIGMPPFVPVWVALLITYTVLKVPKSNKYLLLVFFTLVITYTRSMLFTTIIIATIVIFIAIMKNPSKFGHGIKIFLVAIIGVTIVALLIPNAIEFWVAKLSETFNEELTHDVGTLAFREELINNTIYSIRHNPLFGLGYIRDVAKGEYSIVMGGDTYIAPILWCEGWIGLILRILPFAILGLNALINLFVKKKGYWLDIVIIACIISGAINYVQTNMITNYPLTMGILILLKIKDNYDRKAQDFSNYSII